ncbi:MAG: hypothetical protein WD022_11765 [Balneolaceae bacterium]
MNERWYKIHVTILILVLAFIVPKDLAKAQVLSLEIEPSPTLENAQTLSLTGLGIDSKASGPVLISAFLENLTGEKVENLFLEVTINAAKIGNIVELTQDSDRPFSLDPYQTVYATNNDLAKEAIPGVEESIGFSGGLTSEGDDFINNLSGTTLPKDVYTVEVVVFQVTDATGRTDLVSSVAEVGGSSLSSFDEGDIFLKTPGDIVGGEAEITNPYPQFSWEGANNVTYRLLVVHDNGQDSPESLLQSAKSSDPMSEGGSLLQFENLDVYVNGTSFQFPSSGAQALKAGETYHWRVMTTIQSSGDVDEITSEIWSFKLMDTSQASSSTPISDELELLLIELMGNENYRRLQESGFTLDGVEYDGQEFIGPAAAIKLEELLQKIRDEEIILGQN